MNYIKGKIKKVIFQNNDNGYIVALFRIKETDDPELKEKINKTITITGTFSEANIDISLTLHGEYKNNEKFGPQFVSYSYEIEKPTTADAITEFLASSFINACGEKTAKRIVDAYGEFTLDKIKEGPENLVAIGLPLIKSQKIYNSLINYNKSSEAIIKLQNLGFTIEECSRIYPKFKDRIDDIFNDSFYDLKDIITFSRLDSIYINNYGDNTLVRIKACLLEAMQILSMSAGDTFYYKEEIAKSLNQNFNIFLSDESFDETIDILKEENLVVQIDRRYFLKSYYDKEKDIAKILKNIDSQPFKEFKNLESNLLALEKSYNIKYNDEQKKAIISALKNNITIISGGPGTGKTTIIKAIVRLFIDEENLAPLDILDAIALLAPTGRASKKLASSTNLPASTIHRYLRWYKDSNDFFYNENNKTKHKLIIVDEVSMIDVDLFAALLKALNNNVKLILVGDTFQLPSVGPGLVLNDLITSDFFNYIPLKQIYRQSNNSYIPYLAQEIKNADLSEEFYLKKDDYSFCETESSKIKSMIEEVIKYSRTKGIDEKKMQILAPMYKGENGIDNLNLALQKIYNPPDKNKKEIMMGDIVFREKDKVLQTINNLDNNVFNGDIGYILDINGNNITIDFETNKVIYEKKDLKQLKHAYAITIHKSQGSEFDHVIMPICHSYYKMLYNKLIYTGVSRAKKTLTIIGESSSFISGVKNNYAMYRKTNLKDCILEVYNKEIIP